MARPSRTGGNTSEGKARNASPTKGRKTAKTKRRIVPAATCVKRRSLSGWSKELEEVREQQAATAEILKVIASSPSDVQPVFAAIASSANRLIGGFSTAVHRIIDDVVHLVAFTPTNPEADEALQTVFPRHRSEVPSVALVQNGDTAQFADAETADAHTRRLGRARGWRSVTFTPLMNRGTFIGFIACTRRKTGVLADHHVQLLRTFADQAVIAIENVRLFNETKDALERQTATADILKVIASSPSDVQPVFDAIVASAARLFEPCSATITTLKEGKLHWNASAQIVPSFDHEAARAVYPIPFDPDHSPSSRATLERRIIAIPDTHAPDAPENTRRISAAGGFRSITFVPLIHENRGIGTIILTHPQAGFRFSDKQLALLQAFADQAVIAIENARLFNEVRQRTEDLAESLQQQTATSEILSVISSSPGDLAPVFDAMLSKAMDLCGANFGVLNTFDGKLFRTSAAFGLPPVYDEYRRSRTLDYGPGTAPARLLEGEPYVEFVDLLESDAYRAGEPNRRALVDIGGARSLLAVPLLKDERVVGNVMIFRQDPLGFSDKQIALLKQFAAQAVIAIENARLLNELRQRTDDLTESLHDLRTAQDRLIQTEKLASLGQLTAGIAHEIKNPLNFVNNFSALSAELTDELNDVLKPVAMDGKVRGEVDELTGLLKDNLEKVVQHGKRADSIVKNMLLHSREGSREHRPADINSLLDESLNLAYHGARAEKGEFNIALQRDFDADAGTIELFPQEITRAFLNLIANGVYAATKRKTEEKEPGFEPTLRATTKNLGTTVEIRIRDNGTGISAEVQEKMFNPFFTTKPAGEGTGLGLSMTHDIIVKQHGGRIDVATEPGIFTEFIITLPRTIIPSKTAGGTN